MKTRDLRVTGYRPLVPPAIILEELPLSEGGSRLVAKWREQLIRILTQADDRLIAIVGAGAVLPEKFSPPARSLVLGVPARVVREARPEDARWTVRAAEHYTELGAWYRENLK